MAEIKNDPFMIVSFGIDRDGQGLEYTMIVYGIGDLIKNIGGFFVGTYIIFDVIVVVLCSGTMDIKMVNVYNTENS